MPLTDVVRAAVSEVEDYARVEVRQFAETSVAGAAVADLTHLLAEIIENAAQFSPPHTRVRVSGEPVGNGYAVEVEDRGLGMGKDALAEANRRIVESEALDLFDSDRLGLFVVSRLAARHDIKVHLKTSPYGGTTAVVLLPTALLDDRAAQERPGTPAAEPLAEHPDPRVPDGVRQRRTVPAPAVSAPDGRRALVAPVADPPDHAALRRPGTHPGPADDGTVTHRPREPPPCACTAPRSRPAPTTCPAACARPAWPPAPGRPPRTAAARTARRPGRPHPRTRTGPHDRLPRRVDPRRRPAGRHRPRHGAAQHRRRPRMIQEPRTGAGRRSDQLDWLLDDLVLRVGDVRHAVVLSGDGLAMGASHGLGREDAEHLAAVASGFHSLAKGAGRHFGAGGVRQTMVEMDDGFLFVAAAGKGPASRC